MPLQVKTTYCLPDRLRPLVGEDGQPVTREGRVLTEREPGSPTRPARDWEVNCWFEEVEGGA